jgi:flagellar FliJ protein
MRRFRFRLQKVLDYKKKLEEEAERVYGLAKIQRELAQSVLEQIRNDLADALTNSGEFSIERSKLRVIFIEASEDRMRQQEIVIETLVREEEVLKERWLEARKERKVLDKLHEKAVEQYQYEVDHFDQIALDEWGTLHRRAA